MAVIKFLAALLLPAIAAAYPQSTSDIPACAYSAVLTGLQSTGCDLTDTACVCAQKDLATSLTSSVVAACDGSVTASDVTSFISTYCGSAGSASTTAAPTTTETSASMTETVTTTTPTIMANGTMTNSTNATWTSAVPSATESPIPSEGGASSLSGMSTMAFAVALGGMTWIFAEL